jgi:two-component sensor histidine kinase
MVAGFNQNYVAMWNVPFALLQTPDLEAITRHMAAQLVDPEGFMATNSELLSHPGREFYDILELRDGRIFERDSRPQRIERDIVGRVWSYRDITERKRAEERVLASLNEKEVLLREIHHRVKNNLQLISGLLDLTRLRTQDPETLGVLTDMMLKIQTMAQIHTRLYESKRFDRINMGRQIQDQITSLSQIYGQKDREILCETELADLYLPIDQAIPCALAVNEILSNAFKHAFKGRAHGFLRVMASQEDSRIRISVQDDGRGIPPDLDIARSRSLGLKLIRNLVENQLKGSLAIRRKGGTEVILEFPILTQEEEHVTDSRSG